MVKSRVTDRVVAYPWLVLTALIVSVPVFVLNLWFDFGFDRYFAFFAVVLSFVFPYLVDKRMNRRQPKKVVFVASSPSQFANEVWNGIHQRLTSSDHRWSLTKNILRGEVSGTELARVVRSELSNGADALCLLPTHTNNEFWNSVERALFASVEVIVIDVRPPEYLLSTPGRPRPYYVAGDYFEGGRLLGRAIVEDLQSDLSANAIVLVGPNQHFSGRSRGREILGEIASASLLSRVVAIPVDEWTPDPKIYETIGDSVFKNFICFYIIERFGFLSSKDVKILAKIKIKYGSKEEFYLNASELGFLPFITASKMEYVSKQKNRQDSIILLWQILLPRKIPANIFPMTILALLPFLLDLVLIKKFCILKKTMTIILLLC